MSDAADLQQENDVVTPEAGRGDRIARRLVLPLLVAALALAAVYVFLTPLRITGDSMEPNLANADRVFRDKVQGVARRGDVIVLDVGNRSDRDDVVKRVVAVGGDTVEIRDDVAWVNGVPESGYDVIRTPGAGVTLPKRTVPSGGVYVLGDNRPVSLDSRFVGAVKVSRVRGRVWFVLLPLSDFGLVR